MATFLDAVNRLLRTVQIIAGDDDDLTNFDGTQHVTTTNLAKIAIQDELSSLVAKEMLPAEKKEGEIITVPSTRIYNLPTDFLRFYGKYPYLAATQTPSTYVFEYPGGYEHMKLTNRNWKEVEGTPNWWYYEPFGLASTNKQIGLFQIPNVALNYLFDYEALIVMDNPTDQLPFNNEMELRTFTAAASRRWLYNDGQLAVEALELDPIYSDQLSTLMRLLTPRSNPQRYGRRHHGSSRGNVHGRY